MRRHWYYIAHTLTGRYVSSSNKNYGRWISWSFFNVNVTDLPTGKVKTNITIPLFIIVLAGKHTPEVIIRFLLRNAEVDNCDTRELKQVYGVVANVLQEAAKDEQLSKYSGIIADIEDNGERVLLSIK